MNKSLTFIVSTNKRNFAFVLPFVYFASKYNINSVFDIHLFECNPAALHNGLQLLKQLHSIKCINIEYVTQQNVLPQQYRFLVEPILRTQYAYCVDVDIMICENIVPFHVHKMQNGMYVYDNEVRAYNGCIDKLSGLHFATQAWYSQTRHIRTKYMASNIKNILDERLLKMIAVESNVKLLPVQHTAQQFYVNRPVHGQHISLSRQPFNAKCPMKDILDPTYSRQFIDTVYSAEFKNLVSLCQPETKHIFNSYLKFVKLPVL